MGRWIHIALALALGAAGARAEAPRRGAVRAARKEKSEAKLFGRLALRPTWFQNEPTFLMGNTAELGIAFNPRFKLSYLQDFNTNESPTGSFQGARDFTPVLQDGLVRFQFKEVARSRDGRLTYDHQTWVYLPTKASRREAGMITAIRNFFILKSPVSDNLTFSLTEVPIVHVYDRDGIRNDKGDDVPNPAFENRLILEMDWELLPGLTLGVPLMLQVVRYREFGDGEKSGTWQPALTFFPWLELALGENVAVGAYYETGSLATPGDYGLTWGDGLGTGLYQLYLQLSF